MPTLEPWGASPAGRGGRKLLLIPALCLAGVVVIFVTVLRGPAPPPDPARSAAPAVPQTAAPVPPDPGGTPAAAPLRPEARAEENPLAAEPPPPPKKEPEVAAAAPAPRDSTAEAYRKEMQALWEKTPKGTGPEKPPVEAAAPAGREAPAADAPPVTEQPPPDEEPPLYPEDVLGPPAPEPGAYQGFGAKTRGGAGGKTFAVTTLKARGPGSLDEALSMKGPLNVVFKVGGTIKGEFVVRHPFVTLDGSSAPGDGVTIQGSISVNEYKKPHGAHDVVIRGLRVRGGGDDTVSVLDGAYNVVVDHCSLGPAGDGALDVTRDSKDVTVSWCILSGTEKAFLVSYGAKNVSIHHSIFFDCASRNPQGQSGAVVDARNLIVWNFSHYGIRFASGTSGNIVNCLFKAKNGTSENAIADYKWEAAKAHIVGNEGPRGRIDPGRKHNSPAPIPSPPVETWPVGEMAAKVLAGAGARPLDSADQAAVETIRKELAKGGK